MVFLSKTKLKEEECKKKKILSFQHKDFYPNKTKTFFFPIHIPFLAITLAISRSMLIQSRKRTGYILLLMGMQAHIPIRWLCRWLN